MEWPEGLDHHEKAWYLEALRTGGTSHISGELLDREENHKYDLTPSEEGAPALIDGQIDTVRKGRSINFTVEDPLKVLAAVEGTKAAQYMARFTHEQYVEELGGYVPKVCFTGVVDDCIRTGPVLNFIGRGKKVLAMFSNPETFTIPSGVKLTEAAMRIMEHGGEVRSNMDIPDRPATLRHDLVVHSEQWLFEAAENLLLTIGLQLAYHDSGQLFARPFPTEPIDPVFGNGDTGWIVGYIQHGGKYAQHPYYVNEAWTNCHGDLVGKAQLPADHPGSSKSLGRNGVPYVRRVIVPRPKITKQVPADQEAERVLDEAVRKIDTVSAEIRRFPLLDELDVIALNDGYWAGNSTVDTSSFFFNRPTMTIGWNDLRSSGPAHR